MRIIIIDSEKDRRRALLSILKALGYKSQQILSTEDPRVISQMSTAKDIACVFMQSEMRGVSWHELLQDARKKYSDEDLPMILLSSTPTREKILAAYEAGVNGVLKYPCSSSDVEDVLKLIS